MKYLIFTFIFATLTVFTVQQQKSLFLSTCGSDITYNTCCIQSAQIMVLASTSAQASSDAVAAAQAAASVATSASISAAVASSSTAEVSISQAVAITLGTGKCCEISTNLKTQANSAANATASASAEASARAEACAKASAAANAAAQAAALINLQASTLVKTSCCNYAAEFTSMLSIIGNFSAKASAAAQAAQDVSLQLDKVAKVTFNAAVSAQSSANAMASNSLNTCCSNIKIRTAANSTATACAVVTEEVTKLISIVQDSVNAIKVIESDGQKLSNCGTLSDRICASQCANVPYTCCNNYNTCAASNPSTACNIGSEIGTKGLVSASAKVRAAVIANVYIEIAVYALAQVIVKVKAATEAAVFASSAVTVTVEDCCNIGIQVETSTFARASAVGLAYASAKAAALAYANATSFAAALAEATAAGIAQATASAKIFTAGNKCGQSCCTQCNYPFRKDCCFVSSVTLSSIFYSGAKECNGIVASALAYVKEGVKSAITREVNAITDALKSSVTKNDIFLQCCCCSRTTAKFSSKIQYQSTATLRNPELLF